jgi:CDP-glucose 4,6-dehydratase
LMFSGIYKHRRVLVTGHTGFKGSWLCEWLLSLGAEVAGYAIGVPTEPAHYTVLGLNDRVQNFEGDIRDRNVLQAVFQTFKPEIVFHLAAQPIVRLSYEMPAYTFETNTLGTLNVLECIRASSSVTAGVIITSDKCYKNQEWIWGYRETDVLGGDDPYSASKACAELIFQSFAKSFMVSGGKRIATARAGNVIGGGDWAPDRIVPDCVRRWSLQETVEIRSPNATRPWQHVLEPLGGYLWLGAQLWQDQGAGLAGEAFNFGPPATVNQSVAELIDKMAKYWASATWKSIEQVDGAKQESTLLKLNCDKALNKLNWQAVLSFTDCIHYTSDWYRVYYERGPKAAVQLTSEQINSYADIAHKEGLSWTQ